MKVPCGRQWNESCPDDKPCCLEGTNDKVESRLLCECILSLGNRRLPDDACIECPHRELTQSATKSHDHTLWAKCAKQWSRAARFSATDRDTFGKLADHLARSQSATRRDIHAEAMYDLARWCGWNSFSSTSPVSWIMEKMTPENRSLYVGDE